VNKPFGRALEGAVAGGTRELGGVVDGSMCVEGGPSHEAFAAHVAREGPSTRVGIDVATLEALVAEMTVGVLPSAAGGSRRGWRGGYLRRQEGDSDGAESALEFLAY